MRCLPILILLFIYSTAFSQIVTYAQLKNLPTHSWYKLCYKVPADSAFEWVKKESINFKYLDELSPLYQLNRRADEDSLKLSPGMYIWVTSNEANITGEFLQISNNYFNVINTKKQYSLVVLNKNNLPVSNATVSIGKKKIEYSKNAAAYLLPKKNYEEEPFMIMADSDTLIGTIDQVDSYDNGDDWKSFPVVKQIFYLGRRINDVVKGKNSYHARKRIASKQTYTGFVVFNKPKYRPLDTVKLKAWLTNSKNKPLKKPLQLWIKYRYNSENIEHNKSLIYPVTPGSYTYELVLDDSLPSNTNYTVQFKGKKEYNKYSSMFKIEEYMLPDITDFSTTSEKDKYYANDTIRLFAKATDALGLPILNGRLRITATTRNVEIFYDDTLFVPDTLYTGEMFLSPSDKTKIEIPTTNFPGADLSVEIVTELINSANEIVEERNTIAYYREKTEVEINAIKDSILFTYSNSKGKNFTCNVIAYDDDFNTLFDTTVALPYKIKLHPSYVSFDADLFDNNNKLLSSTEYEIDEKDFASQLYANCKKDSIGFFIDNPHKQLLYLTLWKGNKKEWEKQITDSIYNWADAGDPHWMYNLQCRYIVAGKIQSSEIRLAVLKKQLNVTVNQMPVLRPGAKDIIDVTVTDYKNRNVKNANLTALAQNDQLKTSFNFASLPVTAKYKSGNESWKLTETNIVELSDPSNALLYPHIRANLGMDSMIYYSWLFSKKPISICKTSIKNPLPEIAVHAVKSGQPEPVYIVYLNNMPAWFYGVNSNQPYSTIVQPGYAKIGLRIKNKLVELDSIYVQPYYKHDIFIGLDNVEQVKDIKVTLMPDTLLAYEKNKLASSFAIFENHKNNKDAVIRSWPITAVLTGNSINRWIAGPFTAGDSLTAFKRGEFLFKFPFEAGYMYNLSSNLTRLEKTNLLAGKIKLNMQSVTWKLGDTIPAPTDFTLKINTTSLYLNLIPTHLTNNIDGDATIQFQWPKDTSFAYIMLSAVENSNRYYIFSIPSYQTSSVIQRVAAGSYRMVAITKAGLALQLPATYKLYNDGINCIAVRHGNYSTKCILADSILHQQFRAFNKPFEVRNEPVVEKKIKNISPGSSSISGRITDKISGDPVAGVTVLINGNAVVSTDNTGLYVVKDIANGSYKIEFSSVGYNSVEKNVLILPYQAFELNIELRLSETRLDDVVVIGYGVTKRKNLSAAITTVNSYELQLEGRLAGVNIAAHPSINIRGLASIQADNEPLYIVDGVVVNSLADVPASNIASMEVLKDEAATAIYGARAANGAIIVTTNGNIGPSLRTTFRDYAYWQPNIITNKNGKASIPVVYPENITGWTNQVYAAGSKGRYGRATTHTKIFKSLQGLLTVPLFLTESDSIQIIGKAMNYDTASKALHTLFKSGNSQNAESRLIQSNAANTHYLPLQVPDNTDTLTVSFMVQDDNDNADGESKKIPVMAKGAMETSGLFIALKNDTSFNYVPSHASAPVTIFAEEKLIDLLNIELEELINYPQQCMEQTANKLWGLLMAMKVRTAQNQPFNYEKRIRPLLTKILQNQNSDGGWPWWPSGNSDLHITTKVLQALTQLDSTEFIYSAKRKANLFLQNKLDHLSYANKLVALLALAESGHFLSYKMFIDSLPFAKLTIHQQWQTIRIMQLAGIKYDIQLEAIWKKKHETITGAMFWGNDNWYWQNNLVATTILAYKVCKADSNYQKYASSISQYFLEQRGNGAFRNTIEKAELSALFLNEALKNSKSLERSSLFINNQKVQDFPYKKELEKGDAVHIRKTGNELIFLSTYQQFWNNKPAPVDSLFSIATNFKQNGRFVFAGENIEAGKKASLEVTIINKKAAEYVQLEIPIPAGCWFSSQSQNTGTHVEYLKNKVLVFFEKLPEGEFNYKMPLDVRFAGKFIMNPAEIKLMYYPTFYGRNETKHLLISQ